MAQTTSTMQHICPSCSVTFTRAFTLSNHMNIHSQTKPHQCNVCKKRFTRRNDLKIHVSEIHENPQEYTCAELGGCATEGCPKTFSSKRAQKTHVRTYMSKRRKITQHVATLAQSETRSTEQAPTTLNILGQRTWTTTELSYSKDTHVALVVYDQRSAPTSTPSLRHFSSQAAQKSDLSVPIHSENLSSRSVAGQIGAFNFLNLSSEYRCDTVAKEYQSSQTPPESHPQAASDSVIDERFPAPHQDALKQMFDEEILPTAIEYLPFKSTLVNALNGHSKRMLYTASYQGHEEIVKQLLSEDANVNVQGGLYGNALQAASSRGHEKIVDLLLRHNADVNAQGGEHGNALQAASNNGHEKIVELLLSHNADVNAQGGFCRNALQAASSRGHEKIVELLFSHNADVNAQGGYYGNALQAASNRGHKKIVELLLSHNADVNAQGGEHGNALLAASSNGYEMIVELLLSHNVDVNAQGGLYRNALQAASSHGHEKIIELLLSHDVDVNAQGGFYGNALQAASNRGHKKIVELLLRHNADVNAQGGLYWNAL